MRKRPAAESERDASQHAVGGKARVNLFFIIFINQFKPFFFSINLKNAPGKLQTPRGRHFGTVLWNAPGGVYSVFYGLCEIENADRKRKTEFFDLDFSIRKKKLSYAIGFWRFPSSIFRSSVFDRDLVQKWG